MTVAPIDAFPLTWPHGWPRTDGWRRKESRYEVTFTAARDGVLRSVRLLGGRHPVLSTNVPLRRDGIPLAGQREPNDVGVAVYWTDGKNRPRVIACDVWKNVRDNVRAIGLALEGLRAVERAGASTILERAFTGFAALPAAAGSTTRPWRTVLCYQEHEPVTREKIEATFRALAKIRHPDVAGGSHELMTELNAARAAALAEVS